MKSTIGRFLFAIPMAIFGLFHFMSASDMAAMVPVPGGIFWVYLTGIALLAAAISIMMNKLSGIAALLLGILLLVFAFSVHLPAVIDGNESSMPSFLKDIALAGAAFFLSDKAEG